MDSRSLAVRVVLAFGALPSLAYGQDDTHTPPTTPSEQKLMPNSPEQTISALNDADRMLLREQRAVVEKILGDNEDSKRKYQTAAGKLGTIRAILEAGLYKPDQTHDLQCLGIVLGDAFVLDLGMEWIVVEDEYGRDAALRMPNTSIIIYPKTMISKRIERGEEVDVFDLYNYTAEQVEALKQMPEKP